MPRRASEDKSLGVVFRRLREARGESQESLAYRAGITSGTLARLELGQSDPTWTTIRAVARALDVSLRDLGAAVEAQDSAAP
jgi:XRE family transcriptional regulator, regulator of sulfur utilization